MRQERALIAGAVLGFVTVLVAGFAVDVAL
jgi:hypothetical protein